MSEQRSVLVATPEPLGERRAGPAVRALRMAETIAAAGHHVTLVSTAPATPTVSARGVVVTGTGEAPTDAQVIIVTGRAALDLPWLPASDAVVGVDLYDPYQLEALHRGGTDRIRRVDLAEGAARTLALQLGRGDRFFCANEEQRSLWLGYLGAFGRLNPATHEADPSMRALIDLAPFGVDALPPTRGRSPVRDPDTIGPDDPVAIWAGGLHEWLDPVTVVRAAGRVAEQHPRFRMVFVAGPAPASGSEAPIARSARSEADALGLLDRTVFFHDDWVPFDDRGPMLTDAAMGVCAHQPHLETRFSHRTRFLDHLWAGLPTVSTGGDPLSCQLEAGGAARLVQPGDDEALADAMADLLRHPEARHSLSESAAAMATSLTWPDVLSDLVAWVGSATPAADRLDPVIGPRLGATAHERRGSLDRLRMQWKLEGPRGMGRRVSRRLRRPS